MDGTHILNGNNLQMQSTNVSWTGMGIYGRSSLEEQTSKTISRRTATTMTILSVETRGDK